jgi:hypothetical protein
VLCSSQDHLGTGTHDLDHPVLASVENTDSWHARKGDLQHAFPLDVLMVTSLKLSSIANGNILTSVSLSLGETICFGSPKLTTDRFGRLSLSLDEWDSSAIFVGMVHSGSPLLHIALEDSSDEGGIASGMGGSSRPPSPKGATW